MVLAEIGKSAEPPQYFRSARRQMDGDAHEAGILLFFTPCRRCGLPTTPYTRQVDGSWMI